MSRQPNLDRDRAYSLIQFTFQEHGRTNPQYKSDKDLTNKELVDLLGGRVSGLGTILKNMKREKKVDYRGDVIVDNTLLTLVADYNQDATFLGTSYADIEHHFKHMADQGGHLKKASD